ncbi:metal ABC transporter ATP-binding protein [Vagococcus intermedius]|uniref:Metal ABC transporter ATP-binding protein n=1 Tax=Vagococcus intermedius TaxID=2991418 RepID=A0AAF0CVP8_9ENTE|nr:metal ABC transporter ATP-binding protein [Vagococcus intermedius]WEG73748.1 metal ABC transporter ATP-binding protein [Vagococcus intermedius]WEG75833.1 metal ABC transporter ATP-binding protein [Vagococcus intermedius]
MERVVYMSDVHATSRDKSKAIAVEDLTVSYQGKTALSDINLMIQPGAITGIIGPNGAGKSTLLKGMMGLIKTDSGKVSIGNQELQKRQRDIAYVEQRSEIDLNFPITVEEVVLLGSYPKLGLFKRPKEKEKELVTECLKLVKMVEFRTRQIGELSGGQLQRVFIARALAQEADIIFLDEPFVGIDMSSEQVIIDILKQLKAQGKTILIVHHDLHKVTDYFDDVIILKKQLIAYGPVEHIFTSETLEKAYGQTLGAIQIKGVDGE